ncbi:MAG: hypothetical protein V5A51_00605, partial [Bacteroidales bacterium]
ELAIRLNDDNELIPLMNKLKAQYPELSVMSWKDIQPELGMITEWLDVMLYFVMVIILLALCFGIVNTMLMVVMERVKELGHWDEPDTGFHYDHAGDHLFVSYRWSDWNGTCCPSG